MTRSPDVPKVPRWVLQQQSRECLRRQLVRRLHRFSAILALGGERRNLEPTKHHTACHHVRVARQPSPPPLAAQAPSQKCHPPAPRHHCAQAQLSTFFKRVLERDRHMEIVAGAGEGQRRWSSRANPSTAAFSLRFSAALSTLSSRERFLARPPARPDGAHSNAPRPTIPLLRTCAIYEGVRHLLCTGAQQHCWLQEGRSGPTSS